MAERTREQENVSDHTAEESRSQSIDWIAIFFEGEHPYWVTGAVSVSAAAMLLLATIVVQGVFFRPRWVHPPAPPSLPTAPCDLCDSRPIVIR